MICYENSHVLLRNLKGEFPLITHGEGIYLYDQSGKRYLDGSSGAMVVSCGHGNRTIAEMICKQISKLAYVNGTQFSSEPAERLAQKLADLARPLGLGRASFLSSGSEAVEASIKFIRQRWVEKNQPQRSKLIARSPSYHGNTLYALSTSGRPRSKKYFGPLLHDVVMVSAPYEYRSPVKDYMRDGTAFYADELEKVIQQEGAETILGFIVEPIIGSSAGGSIPPKGYFRTIQEICNGQKIPIIADEVLCGSGRTGKFFASEHFDLKPDLLVLGKGLNGGYVPLSALLCREQDVSMMRANTGYFMHAQTYMQAPCMAAAGLAVVEYMEKNKLVEQASLKGKILHKGLATEIANLPHIGFITGMGLLAGIEFVEHKKNKMPFDRSKKIAEGFVSQALKNGLVLWPNVGQVDGINGDLVLVAPPLTISEVEIEELIGRLKQTITDFFV